MATSLRPFLFIPIIVIGAALVALGMLPLIGSAGAGVKAVDGKLLGQSTAPLELPTLPERTTIYAADGSVLAVVFRGENRQVYPFDSYNAVTKAAVLAIEDHGYYQHGAVDVTSILRAFLANVRAGRVVQGGSTIAQQLIKNTETGSEQTLQRKIVEAQEAIRLEKTYSKDQILGQYMNTIYLGNGVYGVGTAAGYYFDKRPQDLTLPQAAMIAGMIAAPERWNPITNRAETLDRRNQVLSSMLLYGFITQSQYDDAVGAPIRLSSADRTANRYGPEPYWVDYVRSRFLSNPRFGKTLAEREQLFYQGGLQIHTTLRPELQAAARTSLRSHYPLKTDPQSAVVSVSARSGAIMAMVDGNERYGPSKAQGQSTVNYAISHRQTGSAFKAFTLAAALEQGVPPGSIYKTDSPITIPSCGGPGGPTYTLSNAEGSGHGFADLWEATRDSINVVFAQLVNQIGPESVVQAAHQMGIESDTLRPFCSITLGVFDVTPLEMTSAYSTLANGGTHCEPFAISRIVGRNAKTIFKQIPQCNQVMPPNVAAQETAMLEGVISAGTGTKARLSDNRPEAGKTGTGQDYTNAWFVGYVPQIATGVWVGYARGSVPMLDVHGFRGFGGDLAAPVWHDVMTAATKNLPVAVFPNPPPQQAGTVPNVVGKKQDDAIKVLVDAKFSPNVITGDSSKPQGTVFMQQPGGGATAPLGSLVTISVSNGKAPRTSVPDVVGDKQAHATAKLEGAGFGVKVETQPVPDQKLDGIVLSQNPAGGSNADVGTTVTIVVGVFASPTQAPHGAGAPGGGAGGAALPALLLTIAVVPAGLLRWRVRGRRHAAPGHSPGGSR